MRFLSSFFLRQKNVERFKNDTLEWDFVHCQD